MHDQKKPTIGFISTWPVYQGTTIDRYAHSLIQGISAAAHEDGELPYFKHIVDQYRSMVKYNQW